MKDITQERLKELLDYDPITGLFSREVATSNCAPIGPLSTTTNATGYLRVQLDGRRYLLHRLAWLYMTGQWPNDFIDHINGVRDDNRWENLREATPSQNQMNVSGNLRNKTGYKGVCWHEKDKRFRAQITVRGDKKHLGSFKTAEEAHEAYCKAAEQLHKDFSNVGGNS